ncbi:phage tail assembly chaperone [Chelatococcus sp. SYSU_G07232]|uniref:Phage tail assembly chaperone n=1 Tax=Chelatococcus albus TaxID=3047466 RepID=A0ABT7AIV4_9HYPH|nr:rcc01693 family protein [Chelatococcus sp. SYSU_G07232]MDJ1159025.1 phage tail assembly chaperone [Chelatococcus sp. SYSU_G07232]
MIAAGRGEGGAPRPFPWREVMAFGLGVLRLGPDAFWRLTPRELAAAVEGFAGPAAAPAPPGRAELAALMRAFPDG